MGKNMSVGAIAYIVGFFGALLVGVLSAIGVFEMGIIGTTTLILAGVLIGLMNISNNEKMPVMVASLIIGAGAGVLATLPFVGDFLVAILGSLAKVVIPAGIVVAFMVIMEKLKK
jgi:hypothetical protein